jgi:hypothetical protein
VINIMRAPFKVRYVFFAYFAVFLTFVIAILRITFGAFDNGFVGFCAFFVLLPIFFDANFHQNNNTVKYDVFFGYRMISAVILFILLWLLAMDYLNIAGPDDHDDWKSIFVIFSIIISADSAMASPKKTSST